MGCCYSKDNASAKNFKHLEEDAGRKEMSESDLKRVVSFNSFDPSRTLDEDISLEESESKKMGLLGKYTGLRDPREQISEYFQAGSSRGPAGYLDHFGVSPDPSEDTDCFTVWRPTSDMAIELLVNGKATGKGLDIKGKSATTGMLSGYVPFLQIKEEAHKKLVARGPRDARLRLYFHAQEQRAEVEAKLRKALVEMTKSVAEAESALATADIEQKVREELMTTTAKWNMVNPCLELLDDCDDSPRSPAYGIEMPERLFWEVYVVRQDITEEAWAPLETKIGEGWCTGRPSQPAFMELNFSSSRLGVKKQEDDTRRRVVVWQFDKQNAMNPRSLLVAYAQSGTVLPVSSDFDCFLVATKGVEIQLPLAKDQFSILKWCLHQIEEVLSAPLSGKDWTGRWLEVLKEEATTKNFKPAIPEYGYGDPMTYDFIATKAELSATLSGAVRHGAECFNFYFPQKLDEQFLVVWKNTKLHKAGGKKTSERNSKSYAYLSEPQLREFLLARVKEGFAFPLNLKWVLCDPGWYEVLTALRASKQAQEQLESWYPVYNDIDLLKRVEEIHKKFPNGFVTSGKTTAVMDGDMAEYELERQVKLHRAKKKLRALLVMLHQQQEREEKSS